MVTELVNINEPLTKELINFYIARYNNIINISSFVKLPAIYQIGVINEFLAYKNISYVCNFQGIHICYVDQKLHIDNVTNYSDETGKLINLLKSSSKEMKFATMLDANKEAIKHIFKIIVPF
jgi:hypothetical protein